MAPGGARGSASARRSARSRTRSAAARCLPSSSRRFSRASRSSRGISSAKRASPFSSPWVSEPMQKPPFRPDAPKPIVSPSSTTTSRSGSSAFACSAAHSPVNPPPTMQRSASVDPSSGGSGRRGDNRSSQNARGRRPRMLTVRRVGGVVCHGAIDRECGVGRGRWLNQPRARSPSRHRVARRDPAPQRAARGARASRPLPGVDDRGAARRRLRRRRHLRRARRARRPRARDAERARRRDGRPRRPLLPRRRRRRRRRDRSRAADAVRGHVMVRPVDRVRRRRPDRPRAPSSRSSTAGSRPARRRARCGSTASSRSSGRARCPRSRRRTDRSPR